MKVIYFVVYRLVFNRTLSIYVSALLFTNYKHKVLQNFKTFSLVEATTKSNDLLK